MTAETAFEEHASEQEAKPNYCVLKLDETRNWTPEIAERAKKILGVYLFDASKCVHCCEFTPSYECLFVESQWHNPDLPDRDADWLSVEIMEADNCSDPVRYFHCREIDGLPRIKEGESGVGVIDFGIQDEEEALEYLRQRSV